MPTIFGFRQSGIGNKVALTVLKNSILAGFNSYLNSLDVASSAADTDVFYIRQIGGTEKKVTLAAIKTALNITLAPGSTTENKIPQWDSTAKTLKDGLTLRTTVRAEGSTDNISIPTEEAVREAVEAFVSGQDDIAEDLSDTDEMLVYNDSGAVHAKKWCVKVLDLHRGKIGGRNRCVSLRVCSRRGQLGQQFRHEGSDSTEREVLCGRTWFRLGWRHCRRGPGWRGRISTLTWLM